jgi:1,4-dihydroxy-2-naphthoyl-CoA hydrolase
MYVAHNKVRMHDTDMAGIIFFGSQFRIIHDAWEDLMAHEELSFDHLFTSETYAFVIVHAEADYLAPLKAGDKLTIHVSVEHIGTTSFTIHYKLYKSDDLLVGTAQTVHVTINRETHKKIDIPEKLRETLKKYAPVRT